MKIFTAKMPVCHLHKYKYTFFTKFSIYSFSCMHITYLRLSPCKEIVQLVLERESKGLKVSNVRSSCTMISSTKTLFPRFAFCLRFKYVLRPHVLGLQVFGF